MAFLLSFKIVLKVRRQRGQLGRAEGLGGVQLRTKAQKGGRGQGGQGYQTKVRGVRGGQGGPGGPGGARGASGVRGQGGPNGQRAPGRRGCTTTPSRDQYWSRGEPAPVPGRTWVLPSPWLWGGGQTYWIALRHRG